MTTVACICTKEIRVGLPVYLQQAKSLFQTVGVAHEANVAAGAVIVLPYRAFLILRLTRSNLGQTRIIFKPGLTHFKDVPEKLITYIRSKLS